MCDRIIKDFYIPELKPEKKPRIFGMTASPVDANEDVIHAARLDERIEDSRVRADETAGNSRPC